MRLWRYSYRALRRRPGRTILTTLGIVLGVASVVSISVTIRGTRRVYQDMFETVTGRASLEVVAAGQGGFEDEISSWVSALPGVEAAIPAIQLPAGLAGASGAVPVLAIATGPVSGFQDGELHMVEGSPIGSEDGVVLTAAFAAAHRLSLGDSARVIAPTGIVDLPIRGLADARGVAAVSGGAVVFMPLSTARRVFGMAGQVNVLRIVVEDSANVDDVASRIGTRLPAGLAVQTPASRGAVAQEMLFASERGLSVLSIVAIVAGAFVVLNALLMSLGEREREFAILRSLGAARGQLTRMVCGEALALGFVGTGAGIVLGMLMAIALNGIMSEMLGVAMPPVTLDLGTVVVAALMGPGVALGASFVPAWRAGRRPPLDGLLHRGRRWTDGERKWPAAIGAVLVVGAFAFQQAVVRGWLPKTVVAPLLPACLAVFMIGVVLAMPLVRSPMLWIAGRLLRRLFGTEGRIAVRQVRRRPVRTALTAGVIAALIMVSIGFGNTMASSVEDAREWGRRISEIDFFVRAFMPDTGIVAAASLPETTALELARIEHVRRVDKLNFVPVTAAGLPTLLLAKTYAADRETLLDLVEGDSKTLGSSLAGGEVVVGTTMALRAGLSVGDTIEIDTRAGPRGFSIAGLATEYTAGGMAVYMEWELAKRLFRLNGVHVLSVIVDEAAKGDATDALAAYCAQRGYMLDSRANFRQMIDDSMAGVLGSYWVLMILGFVVAGLGIVNTLTMNVLEQTREIGVLRAVAMKRGQLRRMIVAQALSIAVVGVVPGVAFGALFSFLMHSATQPLTGQVVEYRFEASLAVACLVGAVAMVVIASIPPARAAARLSIVKALQYE